MAAVFLMREDDISFRWNFTKFEEMFGCSIDVIFTDQDVAMGIAFSVVWSHVTLLLCIFHIWKYFWKHMKPLFSESNKEHWKEVSNMLRKLFKNTDSCG